MFDVILFGGTTEGRLLAEYCAGKKLRTLVSVVSDYGELVLPESPFLAVSRRAMTSDQMAALFLEERPRLVLDATHPYAAVVTDYVRKACQDTGSSYVRISRDSLGKPENGDILWVDSVEEAVDYIKTTEGPVFVTTGSKELEAYRKIKDYEERLYVRVLPDSRVMGTCESMGISGKHLIGMQGPFSKEMNIAMLRQTGARYLVTKEAGTPGGYREKIEAALECGVCPVVIGRPGKPEGVSLEEGMRILDGLAAKESDVDESDVKESSITEFGIKETGVKKSDVGEFDGKESDAENAGRLAPDVRSSVTMRLNLIGIGMGGSGQLTLAAAEELKRSDAVLGAPRMLESVGAFTESAVKKPSYLSGDVLTWLKGHREYKTVSVVYSGDTGFHSGAKTLLEELSALESDTELQSGLDIRVFPGISTVSYLCARLKTSWEEVYLASAHGAAVPDVLHLIELKTAVFLLLGGEGQVESLCRTLADGGYPDILVSVGERLSYPDERIVTGTASELKDQSFGRLAAILIRKENRK